MVAEAETEQAPGTWVEVESCIKSCFPPPLLSLYPSYCIQMHWVTWEPLPAGFSFAWGPFVLPPYPEASLLLDYPPPHPTPFL